MGGFTSSKALIAAVTTVLTAFLSLLIAAGAHVRPELRDAIVTFVTVTAPVLVGLFGALHHGHTKVAAADKLAQGSAPATVPAPSAAIAAAPATTAPANALQPPAAP